MPADFKAMCSGACVTLNRCSYLAKRATKGVKRLPVTLLQP